MPLNTCLQGDVLSAKTSNFLNPGKIADGGEVRFSFLGNDSIGGKEVWVETPEKRVPLRFSDEPSLSDIEERAKEIGATVPADLRIQHFFAFAVWNYSEEAVQVFQFTQKSIGRDLDKYLSDEEISLEPQTFDFKLEKVRTGPNPKDVRYPLTALPGRRRKPDVAATVDAAWAKAVSAGFNLRALLTGGDPFNAPTNKACGI